MNVYNYVPMQFLVVFLFRKICSKKVLNLNGPQNHNPDGQSIEMTTSMHDKPLLRKRTQKS
jgi:hypothetical protein